MKIYNLIYAIAAVFLITSCSSDDGFKPTLDVGDSFQIIAPTSGVSLQLSSDDQKGTATTFTYGKADFGFSSATTYKLELDLPSGDFSAPITIGSSNSVEMPIMVGDLNNAALGLGFPAGNPANMNARIIARIDDDIDSIVSNVIAIEVTPFQVQYPFLHVPGAYQGWNPSDSSTVIYSLGRDGKYDGYIYFQDVSEFKFTDGPSWDMNFGDTGNDGILDANGDNITTVVSGMHHLTVNLNTMTYTAEATDWGVIGNATPTGWDADTDMVYDDVSGTLKLNLDLVPGEIKFRANDAWDLNYGDTDANSSLENGGDNIVIADGGNYDIELILNQPVFSYRLNKN